MALDVRDLHEAGKIGRMNKNNDVHLHNESYKNKIKQNDEDINLQESDNSNEEDFEHIPIGTKLDDEKNLVLHKV